MNYIVYMTCTTTGQLTAFAPLALDLKNTIDLAKWFIEKVNNKRYYKDVYIEKFKTREKVWDEVNGVL